VCGLLRFLHYNKDGIKTLRGYTRSLDLRRYERLAWKTEQAGVDAVVARVYSLAPIAVVPDSSIPYIARLDQRSYDVGFIGVNMDGLFKPH
jgi:hypothetical protein